MSGVEFDVDALVRVLGSTELSIVNAALGELGLGDGRQMAAAVSVLDELDDEIRLLRRYRVAQENSLQGMFAIFPSFKADLQRMGLLLLTAPALILINVPRMIELAKKMVADLGQLDKFSQANAKATRLARAKLEDLIETRGKIALILGE